MRHEPCPCGSDQKYKKCCLNIPQPEQEGTFIYTDLDDLSNQVPALIKLKKYAEAEEICQRLMDQYPDQIDGLHNGWESKHISNKGELEYLVSR